jgi:hypothetical protein
MSGVIGWLVGSGTLNEATGKTSPLVTRGMGFHRRLTVLGGWTVHPIRDGRIFRPGQQLREWVPWDELTPPALSRTYKPKEQTREWVARASLTPSTLRRTYKPKPRSRTWSPSE